MEAKLLLEDGTLFIGKAFGATGETSGEVVFNTGITGYQEVLTDPSYCGQIVTMTYPLIGNYGISRDDFESIHPFAQGFIVRSLEDVPSNWRAEYTLDEMLKHYGVIGIKNIDTRMLTRKLRQSGTMKGIITTTDESLPSLNARLENLNLRKDQVAQVSTSKIFSCPGAKERVVVVDFGAKNGILRHFIARNCDVVVVPYNTTAEEIRRLSPDGIMLTNGPGDPKDVPEAITMIRDLLGKVPIFGICLGHQLFALACGADTFKLRFGHRGGNHPVKELATGRCYITSQNHGYSVSEDSITSTDLEVTHINNNDRTIEGLKHKLYPAFSVQYHPEAAPGPYDSDYLFDQFIAMIQEHRLIKLTQPSQQALIYARCENKAI